MFSLERPSLPWLLTKFLSKCPAGCQCLLPRPGGLSLMCAIHQSKITCVPKKKRTARRQITACSKLLTCRGEKKKYSALFSSPPRGRCLIQRIKTEKSNYSRRTGEAQLQRPRCERLVQEGGAERDPSAGCWPRVPIAGGRPSARGSRDPGTSLAPHPARLLQPPRDGREGAWPPATLGSPLLPRWSPSAKVCSPAFSVQIAKAPLTYLIHFH